jgi:hypothetical protein
MKILERIAYTGCIIFDRDDGEHFKAEKLPVYDNPLCKSENDGKWKLSIATYHSHRFNKPLKIKIQQPRWKRQGYFDTIDDCRKFINSF